MSFPIQFFPKIGLMTVLLEKSSKAEHLVEK